ncbi:MAG TPA: hypothetical protein VKU41_15385 [Polyangiaceae bacterium]|nr:hypothetical protein [Polyangiaceae bacterium]
MPYASALLFHSLLRWAILATGAMVVVRSAMGLTRGRPWGAWDRRAGVALLSCMDAQVLLGLVLYLFLSPVTPKSLADFHASMAVAPLRFFAVEHPTGMLLATIAVHTGWALGKRAPADRDRHRRVLVGVLVALALIAVGVPWPWLSHGRPLVRGP